CPLLIIHSTHARSTARMSVSFFFLGLVGDYTLGGQQHTGDRSGIFKCNTGYLGRVDDAGPEEVLVFSSACVETIIGLAFLHLLYDDAAFETAVANDLTEGLFERAFNDRDTGGFVFVNALELFQGFNRADIRDTAAGNDTFFNCSAGSVQGVVDAVFLFFHFYFGSSTYVENGYTAGQFGQTLLQLFLIVIGSGGFDLGLDLVDAGRDLVFFTLSTNDRGVVFVDTYRCRSAQIAQISAFQFITLLFADHDTLGEDRDVLEHFLAAVAKAGSLNGSHLDGTPKFIDYEGSECFTFEVFGNDHQRTAALCNLFQDMQDILHGTDLFIIDQDIRILQLGFHLLAIGNEIRGEIT